jgi:hypothetical protein
MFRSRVRPRSALVAGVALAAFAGLALAAAPQAAAIPTNPGDPGDPGDPPGARCLENTSVTTSVNRRTTLGVNTVRYTWTVTPGCGGLVYFVNGQEVGRSGSADIDVTTSRFLSVRVRVGRFGTASGEFGRKFVLAARFVKYSTPDLRPTVRTTSGATVLFDSTARRVLEAVKPRFLDDFEGKRLEIHQIPVGVPVTDLPPYDDLDPNAMTPNPADGNRKNSEVRGFGGRDFGQNGYAIAIGEERGTDDLAHELGHAVLHKAQEHHERISTSGPELFTAVSRARTAKQASGTEPVGCTDAYSLSNADEYWAEGTAAALGSSTAKCSSPTPADRVDEYEPAFLTSHDRRLDCLVRVVYTLPPPSGTPLSCSIVLSPGNAVSTVG